MSAMKRLIEWVLEKHEAGYAVSEIARDSLGILTEDQVTQVILEYGEEYSESADYDDSMDGDFDSSMTSAGFGTDEDYGYYGDGE